MSFINNLFLFGSAALVCESGVLDLFGLGDECDQLVPDFKDAFTAAGRCAYPGIPYSSEDSGSFTPDPYNADSFLNFLDNTVPDRITTLNLKLTTEGVKDAAEQVCGMTVAGFNLSPFCIITDVVWIVAESVEQHQELCNDSIGAYELSATFKGVDAINANMEVMYDTLNEHDADLTVHDLALTLHDVELSVHDGVLTGHDEDIKALIQTTLNNQKLIIELLNTAQGRRPGWNE